MKKRVYLLVTLLAFVIMGFTMNVEAAEIVDRGYCGGEGDGTNLTWTLDSDGVLVIEGQGKMKDWTWEESNPDSDYETMDWHKNNEHIFSVIIRDGIKSIGDYAFYDLWYMKNVILPKSLTHIGNSSFECCYKLSSIDLPESLASIGQGAFSFCNSLKNIVLPESLNDIGDEAFSDCHNLKDIVLPGSLTNIGYGVFGYCRSLRYIVFPDTLTSIGEAMFSDCYNLEGIDLPKSLTRIGDGAFGSCYDLIKIDLPVSLTYIGDGAFADCYKLRKIGLPQSLAYIGERAFYGCDSLESIVLPNSVTSICQGAFSYCKSLRSIYIPSGVSVIEQNAFLNTYLTDAFYGGTKGQWNNVEKVPDDKMDADDNYGLLNATIHYADDDYERLKDFVSRLYLNFFKRKADVKGLYDWVDALRFGRASGAKVVAGFVLSQEYKANSLSNEEYVAALYHIIFNREPDEAGLKAWIGVIEGGCTIKKVLAGFVNSEEFKNLCRDLGIVGGTYNSDEIADQNVKIAKFVARLYKICLERVYEQEGLNYWVNALVDRSKTGSSVVLGFFDSQEFKNRNLDDASFVTTAYRAILGREPDEAGLKGWIDALKRGKPRNDVLFGFLKSTEFENLCKEYRIASGNVRKIKPIWDILNDSRDILYDGHSNFASYDLRMFSDRELKLARNEIFARRGYIFEDREMTEYFGSMAWYKPSIPAKDFDERVFNESERRDLQCILAEEEERANNRATLSENEWLTNEIAGFLRSFPTNGFLWSTFSEPGPDVALWSVLYQVGCVGVDENTLLKELEKEGYIPFTDITYIDAESLDELLFRITGYGLYDKKWNVDDLDYLKSIDIYYIEHGDINPMEFEIVGLKSLGNDVYEVKIDSDYTFKGYNDGVIKIRRIEPGGYQLISVQ